MKTNSSGLSVELAPRHKAGLLLKNLIITASGTFGYGMDYSPLWDVNILGALICKGTTLEPRNGYAQPRLAETPSGLLNAIGLQNIGVERVIREMAPLWKKWTVPVLVNIAGERIENYASLAAKLEGVEGVSGIEVNISCPNVEEGGMEFGTSAKRAAEVTRAVKSNTTLPVIIKLTPNVTDIVEIGLAVEAAGADAVTAINTPRGISIDINKRRPLLSNIWGGLSGPAIKPVALYCVYKLAMRLKIPVIGCGGITSAGDCIEFILAGATAVEIGSALFLNPGAPLDILEGLENYMKKEGIKNLSEIRGTALGIEYRINSKGRIK